MSVSIELHDKREEIAHAVAEAIDDNACTTLGYKDVAEAAANGVADFLLNWSDQAFLEDILPALHAATKQLASRCNLHVVERIAAETRPATAQPTHETDTGAK